MGSDVGELFYGVELTKEQFNKLWNEVFYTGADAAECKWGEEKDPKSLLRLNNPYETMNYYLVVRASEQDSENGGTLLGKHIATDPKWDQLITECLWKDRTINTLQADKKTGWHLVGHYA